MGAGNGVLTRALIASGASVIAVEIHPTMIRTLRLRFAADPVVVVAADAADLRLPRRAFRVVANPPFAIAMALVRRLVAKGSRLVAADLVLPRHIARRWCTDALAGAHRWGGQFDMSLGPRVPSRSFRPAARDAVVLRVRRCRSPDSPVRRLGGGDPPAG